MIIMMTGGLEIILHVTEVHQEGVAEVLEEAQEEEADLLLADKFHCYRVTLRIK
jgi:hypothetical protein